MKTVLKTSSLALAKLLLCLVPAMSFASEGTRGGGVAVEENGQLALRDFVDNTVCNWVTAEAFANSYTPDVANVISRIDQVHWALAEGFREDLKSLRVCAVEGNLKQISVNDKDGVTVFLKDERQAAIRWDDRIWIDMKVFRAIPAAHRTGLVIHEIAHSFLPMDIPMRNDSLRSLVSFLMSPFNKETMAINLTQDNVSYIANVDGLPFSKADYFGVKSPQARLVDQINIVRRLKLLELTPTSGVYGSPLEYSVTSLQGKTLEIKRFEASARLAAKSYGVMMNALMEASLKSRSAEKLNALIQKYRLTGDDRFVLKNALPSSLFEMAVMTGDEILMARYLPFAKRSAGTINPSIFERATLAAPGEPYQANRNLNVEKVFTQLLNEPGFLANIRKYKHVPTPLSADPVHQSIVQKICLATGLSSVRCQYEKFKNRHLIN